MLFNYRPTRCSPVVLRDVPAQRLAYRFEADTKVPDDVKNDDAGDKIEAIQIDFDTRRQDDALLRTVRSPDGQRALVLYGTAEDPSQAFHIDLYSSGGAFLRNVTPPDLFLRVFGSGCLVARWKLNQLYRA